MRYLLPLLLCSCGVNALHDFTTPMGVRVSVAKDDWLDPEAAARMERDLVTELVRAGVVSREVALARVWTADVVLEPGPFTEMAKVDGKWERITVSGSVVTTPGKDGRVDMRVSEAPYWCDYQTAYLHELAHVITNPDGVDFEHTRDDIWGVVTGLKRGYLARCILR